RENIKLEYQSLSNSIKATRTQHQQEVNELIKSISQKTYAYGDVRSENQDILMIIFELKDKLKTFEKENGMNTKFDKFVTSGKLLCVTPLPNNTTVKAKKVLNTKVNADRSKPVTSHSTPKNKGVESSNSVRRPKSKDCKSKNRVLKNINDKSSSAHVRKVSSSVIQLVLWIVDSGCSKHMTGNLKLIRNFVEKFMGIVRFRNDHFASITGYGDYVQESNLYTISISELAVSSLVCLTSKATSTKSWLWHRRLSHLNFGTINQLTSKDLVDGLPKFKYDNDHLCLACEQGKRKKASFPSKLVPSTESKLELLHMDLCGPMRVESINGKKYILVIVDDYSRYT
ncbi:retrovirus-related pol polyprotein from transposon TNT 1-94, partial [Tanacetum coccineum]